jgi:hypothetical protein
VTRTFILLFFFTFAPFVTFAADQWHWVRAGNNVVSAWDISRGDATVTIKGQQFSALLFEHSSDKDPQISLKGTIVKGRLTVKEIIYKSDAGVSTYSGTLTVRKWAKAVAGATGVETITLSDGLGMIGLTRTITN